MGVIRRRAAVGLVAGVISSILLVATLDGAPLALLLGMIAGAGFAIVVLAAPASLIPSAQPSLLADALTGGVAGIPFWIIFSVFAAPIARGAGPQWQIDQLRLLFPHLVGWLLFGALLGVLVPRLSAAADYRFGRVTAPAPPPPETPTRIVILGGGFAGTTTAGYLEEFFGADLAVSFTLISDTNALLFTPMLAEVAASSLEASHISSPLRTSLRRTRVVRGRATAIDLDGRTVLVESGPGREVAEPYDHLVLALGAVSNYLGMTNVEAEAFDFKSLEDAIRIRNHVIEMFERADREPDAATRRAMLTFVVAGGGFAGAELAGGLNDFARGMLAYYPQHADRRRADRPGPLARSHPARVERRARRLCPRSDAGARRHLQALHPRRRRAARRRGADSQDAPPEEIPHRDADLDRRDAAQPVARDAPGRARPARRGRRRRDAGCAGSDRTLGAGRRRGGAERREPARRARRRRSSRCAKRRRLPTISTPRCTGNRSSRSASRRSARSASSGTTPPAPRSTARRLLRAFRLVDVARHLRRQAAGAWSAKLMSSPTGSSNCFSHATSSRR